jgi:hypothetical protein
MFHWIVVMDPRQISREVETIVRNSEVEAVARALRSGNPPRVGQIIDYVIESPQGHEFGRAAFGGSSVKREKPYRVAVEPWHLDAAWRMLEPARRNQVSMSRKP